MSSSLPWLEANWRRQALDWITDQVNGAGTRLAGEVEQPHIQWWSTAMRVPTRDGVLWFKAAQPGGAFESRLTPLIAGLWPDRTVEVVATLPERAWMLTRDAGTRLRDVQDGRVVEHWEAVLPRYAEVQMGMAGRVGEIDRMDVPALRLAELPSMLDVVLLEPEYLLPEQPVGLDDERRERLTVDLPAFQERCQRLAELGIPETLQHDDLHDGNAFLRGTDHVVFDWGDACITHPFHTLVVTLRSLAYRNGWEPGGSEVTRLRDAYLEPWRTLVAHQDLVEAAELARQTGTIQRAMAWSRVVMQMPAAIRAEHVDAVPYGLRLYLLDGPWGTWDDGSF
ncbi:MAG TPA: phosphotransferase [Candidatus Limnocylindria bacterium]|nr:phosphotransferase [Candidatus Limnocylindria bacterium]